MKTITLDVRSPQDAMAEALAAALSVAPAQPPALADLRLLSPAEGAWQLGSWEAPHLVVDWAPLVDALLADVEATTPVSTMSARVHNTLAEIAVAVALALGFLAGLHQLQGLGQITLFAELTVDQAGQAPVNATLVLTPTGMSISATNGLNSSPTVALLPPLPITAAVAHH